MQGDDATGKRLRKLSVGQYDNDVPGEPSYNRCAWMKSPTHQAVIPGSLAAGGKTKEVIKKEALCHVFCVQNLREAIGQLHYGNKNK